MANKKSKQPTKYMKRPVPKLLATSTPDIVGITPLEAPDVKLATALLKAGAFPVIHLGHDAPTAEDALRQFTTKHTDEFGVCIASASMATVSLPSQVSCVIAPWESNVTVPAPTRLFYQVCTLDDALKAKEAGATGLIVKGNESAGRVAGESTFILFQRIRQAIQDLPLWVQGGVGVHSAAALTALGATGVVLDSQLILFPACSISKEIKNICEKLAGNETRLIDGYRVLQRPNSPALPAHASYTDLHPYLGVLSLDKGYLPMGQDVALSVDMVKRYRKLPALIFAIREAMHGHTKQAKVFNSLQPESALAKELNITYPIVQGPMTRVSDVPAFAAAVAHAGALPLVAMSLLKGDKAKALLTETKRLAAGKTWGVGILGFAPQALRDEQLAYIKEEKPPIVLIAGGRPSQAKPLEKMGIKTFLHVPSASLLEMFLKEGARRFVFEGRECGGHVGPLASLVLWEKQVERLLQEDHPEEFNILFAGGIHDAASAAFISIMAAPLVARGMKVGVLMGTAYLYTHEAVETGAILPQFQAQAIAQGGTVLLETAPGHETRCLQSPFVNTFQEEKAKLLAQGVDKKEIWAQLESLNVGRLRIAAKGIERRADQLVTIAPDEQLETGMYMIGQVAAMHQKVMSVEALHKNVAEENYTLIQEAALPPMPSTADRGLNVAIIGMACIYPGARNLEEFWRNIILGKDCVTEVPDERWNKELYFDPQSTNGEKTPSKWGGFIPTIDFDPMVFGIPPQSLAAIEPSQLLSLLVARQALENAGYRDGFFEAENVSVIVGAEGGNDLANNYGFRCFFPQVFGEMPQELADALPKMTEDSFPGVLANVIAGRITNRLNLGGRNYTVDAACASSLAAIDLACQELILEKSDMVLAGGVDLHNGINDYLMFSSTHALSRKGKCLTFDAGADGIALGEGVAMVVLKRYEDAQRDGDTIYGVIKGVGGSSDGKSLGLTAPRKSGQMKALERAYEQAGVSPAAIGLLEAHGTGTVVGDRTELSALSDVMLRAGALSGQTHLGSVKTQIGHTKCAAGLAGLIKATLAVYHGVKPPTIHLKQPNAFYNPQSSPFAFNLQAGLWSEAHRTAGVSAFGFGGTNFHAVLENDGSAQATGMVLKSWPAEVCVFRGPTYDDARILLKMVKDLLEQNGNLDMKDIAYSLWLYSEQPVQLSVVAEDVQDLLQKIELILSGVSAKGIFTTHQQEGKVAFMFPGQGSQRVHMARELFVVFPAMRSLLQAYPQYEEVLFPSAAFDEGLVKEQKERIKDTRLAQPLLGMVDLAIARFLQHLGIEPDMVAGHSYGELPALCFAGVFSEEHLVPLSEQRAASILDAIEEDKGIMVAVNCGEEEVMKIISAEKGVYRVNHNSPRQWVLAGGTDVMIAFMKKLKSHGVSFRQLEVACAFHSPLLAKSKGIYQERMADTPFSEPAITVWSNTTAAEYPATAEQIKERLTDHLVQPVRFVEEVQQMYAQGARIFLEVGPGKVLSSLITATLGKDETVLHTEESGRAGMTQLLTALAGYMATGRTVAMEKLFEGRDAKKLDLNNPAQYHKKPTVWRVNGHVAVPFKGKLPAHGAAPITVPLQWPGSAVPALSGNGSAEHLVEEYLTSVRSLVQAQRDVILGYLGHAPAINNGIEVREIKSQAAAMPTGVDGSPGMNGMHGTHGSHAAPKAIEEKEMATMLLQVVSDKTGYPHDMLGMDLDLEADLSIDSIKRMEIIGELKTKLGGFQSTDKTEEQLAEQLAAIKTLNGLVKWIMENTAQAPAPATNGQAIPVVGSNGSNGSHGNHSNGQPVALTREDVSTMLLDVVSDKTGYPQEMLGMDLDLEADLSIDSIKRMEIIGELKNRLGTVLATPSGDEEALAEKLAAIKTLNGLTDWLVDSAQGQTATAAVSNENVVTVKPELLKKVVRRRFQLMPSIFTQTKNPQELKGQRFAIVGDAGDITTAMQQVLAQHGATVDRVAAGDALEAYNGVIILDLLASTHRLTILDLVTMMKRVDFTHLKWVYALSDIKSQLAEKTDVRELRSLQGYAGFLKSLDKEYDHTKCRKINIATQLTPAQVAAVTLSEVLNTDDPSEVVYDDQQVRHIFEAIPAQLANGDTPRLQLEKDSVVVALGGAQGITAELMIGFSKEYPCHYVLVGRSPNPREIGFDNVPHLKTKNEIRRHLIAQGAIKKPAEIEKKTQELFKANQILNTMEALEKNGATVVYHALDLRDEAALSQWLDEVYKTYGRIDGVVHGAGLIEDKLFQTKTAESFERVFSTKVTPVRILAEKLHADTKFVVLFSSVASVHGNRGQTDYAAANSVMDRYAWELRKKFKGQVTAINWGPWKGAGMVSPELEKEYERRGIPLIPLQAGTESFVNELKYGQESQVLIMAE